MNVFKVMTTAFAIMVSPTIIPVSTSSIAAPASKPVAITPAAIAPAETAKRDNLKRGDVTVPIEVSPFFKPQFGLIAPRM